MGPSCWPPLVPRGCVIFGDPLVILVLYFGWFVVFFVLFVDLPRPHSAGSACIILSCNEILFHLCQINK
jgi:hypothetical protein